MRRIDISMPLFPGMPAFPGDPLFATERSHALDRGDPYNLSALRLGSHTGTHVDPPVHFLPGGLTIDRIDLSQLNGPCRIVDVAGSEIGVPALTSLPPGTERVLLRTPNSARWRERLEFFPEYTALAAGGAQLLADRGVRLVGIDSLSIERDPSGKFPVHHRLLGSGVLILEGLLLADVVPGEYELTCLPLNLRAGDGGPARALLSTP